MEHPQDNIAGSDDGVADEAYYDADQPLLQNPFDSKESRILFEAIDQLQSCNAGHDIDIPQVGLDPRHRYGNLLTSALKLVIVGGQSTGKSSLLQSLVDIPFPTGQGCCTRFATRIISRRTPPGSKNECVITIVKPDFDLNDHFNYDTNRMYDSFRHTGDNLNVKEFTTIMSEVSGNYMGIKAGKQRGAKNFATEVLKIELSGPNRSHFSILDIPGVFSNAYNVNTAEMEGVKKMAIEYMKKPQNMVICVADAVTDLANQEVFALAAEHVEKSRLIGVFTKCDNVMDATEVVSIATEPQRSGELKSMQHGWFVVRNRKSDEGPEFDLAAAEGELFGQQPWTRIRETRRGSSMLKQFLGHLLCAKIRREFPSIQQKVKGLLKTSMEAKKALGEPRPSHQHRIQYLVDVIQKFNHAAVQSLECPGRLPLKEMRVRGLVTVSNRVFDGDMRHNGHWFEFEEDDDGLDSQASSDMPYQFTGSHGGEELSGDDEAPRPRTPLTGRIFETPPTPVSSPPHKRSKANDGQRYVFHGEAEPSELRQEIREQIEIFQTNGLPGLLNTDVFPVLYRKQTQKWLEMATTHLEEIAADTYIAATSILMHIHERCHVSPTAVEGLMDMIRRFHREAHDSAQKKLVDYVDKEINFPLQTTNPVFVQEVERLRLKRFQDTTRERFTALGQWISQGKPAITSVVEQIDCLFREFHLSAALRMENEVHDMLKVYYTLSLQSFIDHTTKRVVEDFVSSRQGPLLGLSTEYILGLSEVEVEKLAQEDEVTVSKRNQCNERIARLEKAYSIAEQAWQQTSPRQDELIAV
ncbi:vacuolar sorting protein VPS1 [Xylariales sp. AK1849]|nr:vacuolar sorting protein VPS1 [Xylariales sp. AK1849]